MISFKANLIGETTVKQYNSKTSAYENRPAYFISYDKRSEADLNSAIATSRLWKKGDKYAKNIVNNLCFAHKRKPYMLCFNKFYALTLQKDNFEKVIPEKVLAMAETLNKNGTMYIEFLQVNPKYTAGITNRKYKDCGQAIIESLKNVRRIKDIILASNLNSIKFYEKCNFACKDGLMHFTKDKNRSFLKNLLNNIKLKDIAKRKLG